MLMYCLDLLFFLSLLWVSVFRSGSVSRISVDVPLNVLDNTWGVLNKSLLTRKIIILFFFLLCFRFFGAFANLLLKANMALSVLT